MFVHGAPPHTPLGSFERSADPLACASKNPLSALGLRPRFSALGPQSALPNSNFWPRPWNRKERYYQNCWWRGRYQQQVTWTRSRSTTSVVNAMIWTTTFTSSELASQQPWLSHWTHLWSRYSRQFNTIVSELYRIVSVRSSVAAAPQFWR